MIDKKDLLPERKVALMQKYASVPGLSGLGRILRSKDTSEVVLGEMERQGLTVNYLVHKIKEQLECMHPQFKWMPDNYSRNKILEVCLKLLDAFPAQKVKIDKTEAHVDITMEGLERARKAEKIIDAEIIEET